jgi:hypothetical protein
MTAFP